MSANQDGGPAFPITPVGTGDPRDGMSTGSSGMSLRDWFAGQATATDIDQNTPETVGACLEAVYGRNSGTSEEVANAILTLRCRARYKFADAMLKAREQ